MAGPRRADTERQQDSYPGISELYARVTSLTPAECRDVIAYLAGWNPLAANLAISVIQARKLDRPQERPQEGRSWPNSP